MSRPDINAIWNRSGEYCLLVDGCTIAADDVDTLLDYVSELEERLKEYENASQQQND